MKLNVMLIDKCNLRCKMCRFFGHSKGTIMPTQRYFDILNQCTDLSVANSKITGIRLDGNREALLYPYLSDVLSETKKRGLTAHMVTNATLLTEDIAEMLVRRGLDAIDISVTGISADVYVNFQGYGSPDAEKQLENVVKNVKYLADCVRDKGSKMTISISYILVDESAKDADSSVFFWKNKGVHDIWFNNELYLLEKENPQRIKYRRGNTQCKHSITVAATGDVYPCCLDHAEEMPIGNCFETPLSDIFTSKYYYDFLSTIASLDMNLLPEGCKTCPSIAFLDKDAI